MTITFESASHLADALTRAAAAHGVHEAETGEADPDWPIWYSAYIDQEQNNQGSKPGES